MTMYLEKDRQASVSWQVAASSTLKRFRNRKLTELQVTQIEKLLNEWLETTDDSAAWWDGVRCSDRDMAKSYMFDGRVKTKSFLDWLKEKATE